MIWDYLNQLICLEQDSITLPTVTMEGLTEIDADHIIVIAAESDKADLEASTVWPGNKSCKRR